MNDPQRKDMILVFKDEKNRGKLDYVTAWHKKAAELIRNTHIKVAFVSTNSVIQGEQPAILWPILLDKHFIHIDFAYRTFKWSNDAKGNAAVHCVIIGFSSCGNSEPRYLFDDNGEKKEVENINPYLIDAPNVIIYSRTKPLCDIPKMSKGSQPTDGGFLLLTEEEKEELLQKNDELKPYIKLCYGATEFINNIARYCLWFPNANIRKFSNMPDIKKRLENIVALRENSTSEFTRNKADLPYLFTNIRQPKGNYLLIPSVSSQRRKYIPIGFLNNDVVATNLVLIVPDATLYHFGILTSIVHNAWMRIVCGRLKSDYRYSVNIVYNNFPWPNPTEDQKLRIENAAQFILDTRSLYPDRSLADLYGPLTMPQELLKAHRKLDTAVCKAYGTVWKKEEDCVADLMKMYVELTGISND